MLVYLDTAQFAWLEKAEETVLADFLSVWERADCELAVSLQILQEVHKRGSPEDVEVRCETIRLLQPLRGIPAGSAGVAIDEISQQIKRLLDRSASDPITESRTRLFPPLEPEEVSATLLEHGGQFGQFNVVGAVQAELQGDAQGLPAIRKGDRMDPLVIEQVIRNKQALLLDGVPESAATKMLRELGDRMIAAIHEADGDVWLANLIRLGISDLSRLDELDPEDYSKAAGFIEAARESAEDIALRAATDSDTVTALANELQPYDAPGFSLEMAVTRARARHSREPTAADQVDEEHVSFAPYVDLLFVDKRTRSYLVEEIRRDDGRIAYDPTTKLMRPRDLTDVMTMIQEAATATS